MVLPVVPLLVKVIAGGRTLVRPIVAGQGYETSYHGPVHFGLGDSVRVDRVEVGFQDGTTVALKDIASRQLLTVCQDGRASCEVPGAVGPSTPLQSQISKLER